VLKGGCAFELPYGGALGDEDGGAAAKRNWWAGAREVVRVTKGRGLVVSGGVSSDSNLRSPRDVGNLSVPAC
jgi:ribonuclease P/MRP protein subunit RPP1